MLEVGMGHRRGQGRSGGSRGIDGLSAAFVLYYIA